MELEGEDLEKLKKTDFMVSKSFSVTVFKVQDMMFLQLLLLLSCCLSFADLFEISECPCVDYRHAPDYDCLLNKVSNGEIVSSDCAQALMKLTMAQETFLQVTQQTLVTSPCKEYQYETLAESGCREREKPENSSIIVILILLCSLFIVRKLL